LTHLGDGKPVTGARVRLEGSMTHPGMKPVLAAAREVAPGRYEADLALTMRGDWIVEVEATPEGGGVFTEAIPLQVSAGEPVPKTGKSFPNVGESFPNAGESFPSAGASPTTAPAPGGNAPALLRIPG
jgi:hypothetical protein